MNSKYIAIGLTVLLGVLIIILIIFLIVGKANKNKVKAKQAQKGVNGKDGKPAKVDNTAKKEEPKDYKTEFVQDFMEFDEITDNMIVQKNGDKYIMVIKCQGINYDLMSEAEMISVEEGFIQFLNTLRFPIQLYVQTSSLDLTDSLSAYNERVQNSAMGLDRMKMELKKLEEYDEDNFAAIDALKFEIRKKESVYEYGKDIIMNVERISKNRNILQQTYYVVVPYYISELGPNTFKPTELKEMAFSELYTRCRGLIGSLAVCSVTGKILNSFELAELLYLAYNRDEGELFSFRDAIEAQYDRLYHTAPDILEKKQAKLEEEILEKAAAKANEEIIKASGNVPGSVEENNEMIHQLVYENSKRFIKEYDGMIDREILTSAIENVNDEHKEEKKKRKAKTLEIVDEVSEEEIIDEEIGGNE